MPTVMRAAVYRSPGVVAVEEVPVPEVGPGEMLVRIEACGICGTDLKKIQYGLQPGPRIFGHEMAGIVTSVGASVSEWKPGDRVALFHHVACGRCFYCERGLDAQCPVYKQTVTTAGFEPAGGGMAQYVRVMEPAVRRGTVRVPAGVSLEAAAFIEPVNTCLKGVRRAGAGPGDVLLLFGLGPIGLLLARLGVFSGCRVIGIDPIQERCAFAERWATLETTGSDSETLAPVVRAATEGRGADAALVATPSAAAIEAAVTLVRPGGRVVLFANTRAGERASLDVGSICSLDKEIVGSYSSSMNLIPEAADLIFRGELKVTELISHRFPLSQVADALTVASTPSAGVRKVILSPNE